MSIIDIKFTKFDNTPWGFRLAGGSDFPQPLTVIKVSISNYKYIFICTLYEMLHITVQ